MNLQAVAMELADLLLGAAADPLSLVRFPHRVTEYYDPAKKEFISGVRDLDSTLTNPLFVDDQTGAAKPQSSLQGRLDDLIAGTSEPGNIVSEHKKKIAVALVNLWPNVLVPEFAGWSPERPFAAASSAKIAVLYAAFQLRNELNLLVSENQGVDSMLSLTSAAQTVWKNFGRTVDIPAVDKLFEFDPADPVSVGVSFGPDVKSAFNDFSASEEKVTQLITNVGFSYIASLMLQSGLYNITRSGLWLRRDYGGHNWSASPVTTPATQNITALAAARFFTLLAQQRVVSRADSDEILHFGATREGRPEGVLGPYPCGCVVNDKDHRVDPNILAAKCGIHQPEKIGELPLNHDAFIYENKRINKRYVMIILTIDVDPIYYDIRDKIQAIL